MTGILGYARVSTGDQDVAGQSMRLTQAGAIKVFTDVRSGRQLGLGRSTVYRELSRAGTLRSATALAFLLGSALARGQSDNRRHALSPAPPRRALTGGQVCAL